MAADRGTPARSRFLTAVRRKSCGIFPGTPGKSDEWHLLAGFHATISEQLNAGLAESPRFLDYFDGHGSRRSFILRSASSSPYFVTSRSFSSMSASSTRRPVANSPWCPRWTTSGPVPHRPRGPRRTPLSRWDPPLTRSASDRLSSAPPSRAPGKLVQVTTWVCSPSSLQAPGTGVPSVDVEIFDPYDVKVAQSIGSSISQPIRMLYDVPNPSPRVRGTYTVKVGVFSHDWSALYR